MAPLCGRPLIAWVLDQALALEPRRVLVVVGYRADEVVGGHSPSFIGTRSAPHIDLATITSGATLDSVEIECTHKRGYPIDVSLHAAPIKHVNGTTQYLALATDIGERKQAESDLRYAYDVARDADRRKDEFLALLSHELRNPLSPILTALHLMRLKGDSRTERERQVVERQVNHLVSLVDDLLDVSRITRGKVELHLEPIEIQRVLSRAIEMASPLFEQKRHELSLEVPSQGIIVEVDETRMAQVLANLLTNAAKYTDNGGHIEVQARRDKDRVFITVRDNGIGIRPELLPKIFDLFVQDERGSDRAGGGLGLGLALVRSLVTLHGGQVRARS
jgi:PAS domain S-box-containing protein